MNPLIEIKNSIQPTSNLKNNKNLKEVISMLKQYGYSEREIMNFNGLQFATALQPILNKAKTQAKIEEKLIKSIENDMQKYSLARPPIITFDQACAYMNLCKNFKRLYS